MVDEVIDKYSFQETTSLALVPKSPPKAITLNKADLNKANNQQSLSSKDIINVESISDKTGVLPEEKTGQNRTSYERGAVVRNGMSVKFRVWTFLSRLLATPGQLGEQLIELKWN